MEKAPDEDEASKDSPLATDADALDKVTASDKTDVSDSTNSDGPPAAETAPKEAMTGSWESPDGVQEPNEFTGSEVDSVLHPASDTVLEDPLAASQGTGTACSRRRRTSSFHNGRSSH